MSYVQLAAADSEASAQAEWETLRRRYGALLRDRDSLTMAADIAGRTYWRLRTGPFQVHREAEAFCAELRAVGGACWTATGI